MTKVRRAATGVGFIAVGVAAALMTLSIRQTLRDESVNGCVTESFARIEQATGRPDLDRTAEWESRYHTIHHRPDDPPQGISAREDAVRSLTERTAGALLRGSADAYRLEAEAQIEFELLGKVAHRLGLPAGLLPTNRYAMLETAILLQLETDWSRAGDVLRERATLAPGLYDLALTEIEAELAKIRQAKSEAAGSPVEAWKSAIRTARPPADFVAWLELESAEKAAKIAAREGQLLQEALARNRLDYPARLRALELQLGDGRPRSAAAIRTELQIRNTLAMMRVEGYRPPTGVVTSVEFFKARYRDPLAAIDAEAELRLGHPRGGSVPLPDLLKWMISHMTDAQVFEARAYVEAAAGLLREFTHDAPREFQATVSVDLEQAQEEARLLAQAADERRSKPVATPERITWQGGEFWSPKAAVPPGTKGYRKASWHALEVYLARTHPTAAAQGLRDTLILLDLIDHVADLEKAGKHIADALERARKYFGTDKVPETKIVPDPFSAGSRIGSLLPLTLPEIDLGGVARELAAQSVRVRRSLDRLQATNVDPTQLRELRARVDRNLAALPPPILDTGKPVSPYTDTAIPRVVSEAQSADMSSEAAVRQTPQWREEQRIAHERAKQAEAAKRAERMREIERYREAEARRASERIHSRRRR